MKTLRITGIVIRITEIVVACQFILTVILTVKSDYEGLPLRYGAPLPFRSVFTDCLARNHADGGVYAPDESASRHLKINAQTVDSRCHEVWRNNKHCWGDLCNTEARRERETWSLLARSWEGKIDLRASAQRSGRGVFR